MNNIKRILIVDDDKEFCDTMTDILKAKGFVVESENSGYTAIARIKEKFFEVVLLDVKMPDINGEEIYKKINEINPKIAVIVISAFPIDYSSTDVLKEKAFAYLYKPVDVDEVVKWIESALKEDINILIVDDDFGTRETFKDVFEAKGYKISTASTGKEAIHLSKEIFYDIVFIDVKLPVLTGVDVYLAIRDINPKAIAVLITAYGEGMKDLIEMAIQKGVYTCLTKPLNMDKIVKWVEEISKKVKKER